MSKENVTRRGCRDVFNASLVVDAEYDGMFEFPRINPTYLMPNRLIPFSKALSCSDYDQWIHFYEDDYLFERLWKNPEKYLPVLKKFNGVITPDFSLYRDMPLAMQIWNIYRSRALGYWLQRNGVSVIPNIRYGDCRTYGICSDGISKHCVIAVGTHGNLRCVADREVFLEGFDSVVSKLEPKAVVIYGAAPERFFQKYIASGMCLVQFDSDYAVSHRKKPKQSNSSGE